MLTQILQRLGPVAKNIDIFIEIMTDFLNTDMLAARTDYSNSAWMNQSLPRLLAAVKALNILKNANWQQLDLVFNIQDDAEDISTYGELLSENTDHVLSTVNNLIDQSGQLNYKQKHKQYDECVILIKKLHQSLNEANVIFTEYKNCYLALRSPNANIKQINLARFDNAIRLAIIKQLMAASQQRWQLAVKLQPSLHNFAQLREAAIQKEYVDQIDKLMTLFDHHQNPDSLKEQFIALCREREQNQGTCLSYAAMPKGACNQFYWQLAKVLFAPRTLAKMLKIIMPSITEILVLNGEVDPTKDLPWSRYKLALKLKLQPIDDLDINEFESCDLSRYVVCNSILFDVQSMAKLPFVLHQQLYEKLDAFPALKKIIYRQNPSLSQLQDDITLVTKKYLTPAEAIRQLRTTLILYGETYTGETYATTPAQIAVASFHEYLNELPTEKKNALLQLSSDQKTLHTILNDLGQCIETGAAALGDILGGKNAHLLNERYALSDKQYQKIISKYKNELVTQSDHKQEILPLYLKETLFKRLTVQSEAELIDLLIALPISEYSNFLEHIDIQYKRYLLSAHFAINIDALGEQKVTAFLEGLFQQSRRLGVQEILRFAIKTDKPQAIALAYENDLNEFSIIRTELHTTDLFAKFLRHLTPEKCAVICEKMKVQLSVLIEDDVQLNSVLLYLNEAQCIVFLEAIKNQLPTLIQNANQLRGALKFLYEPSKCIVFLEAIKNQLPTLIQNADQLRSVLLYLNEAQYIVFLEAIKDLLPTLIQNADQLKSVLKNLRKGQCTTVFLKATLQNVSKLCSVLHYLNEEESKEVLRTIVKDEKVVTFIPKYLKDAGSSIFNRARLFHCTQRIEEITWEQIRKHARRPYCFFDKGNRTYRILNSLQQRHHMIFDQF